MKAFLLAAGKGTRLRPYTDSIPKCLMPIDGVPLLEIWLRLLEKHGIDTVLVNLHHHAEKVSCFLSDAASRLGIEIVPFLEERLLGSAGTVWFNRRFIPGGENFVIAYADNLTDLDLSAMIDRHRRFKKWGAVLTMGLFHASEPSACGIAELDDKGKILRFVEKPKTPMGHLANAGIYIASSEIFDYFPTDRQDAVDGVFDFGFHVLPHLSGRMYGHCINAYLRDIGTVSAYHDALKEWPKRRMTRRQ